jgi:hypothetical protein
MKEGNESMYAIVPILSNFSNGPQNLVASLV